MPYADICEAQALPKQRENMKLVSEISTAEMRKDLDFICSEWTVSPDDNDMRQALIATIIKRLVWKNN